MLQKKEGQSKSNSHTGAEKHTRTIADLNLYNSQKKKKKPKMFI